MAETPKLNGRIQIDQPCWDQSTFPGRLKHFCWVTDYRTVVTSNSKLNEAKVLVNQYRLSQEPPGTTDQQVYRAMKLYRSAFHPDTGELQNVIGRMSCQVPAGMVVTAGMLQFYKTNTAVVFWQWINQSFNALVNYTNRNAASSLTTQQITVAYISATTSALITALSLKKILSTRGSPLLQRFVPFMAVASANCVNIPLTRQSEIINGITLVDENGTRVIESQYAAYKAISQVGFSRITMAAPGMVILPVIMQRLEQKPWFARFPRMHMPFQTIMIGAILTFMTPLACAFYPQRSSITLEQLKMKDPEQYKKAIESYGKELPSILYFNKGL